MSRSTLETLDRPLTSDQLAAVHVVMHLFVEEDLANGASAGQRLHCDVCARPRPLPGFVLYGHHRLCNSCATEYEVARMEGRVGSAGRFVRDRRISHAQSTSLSRSTRT